MTIVFRRKKIVIFTITISFVLKITITIIGLKITITIISVEKMERIQGRATKIVFELRNLSENDRLTAVAALHESKCRKCDTCFF